MQFGKLSELVPIRDFVGGPMGAIRLCLVVSCFRLPPQPQVNGVATELEDLSRFTFLHAISLDCLNDFLTQVVAVGF